MAFLPPIYPKSMYPLLAYLPLIGLLLLCPCLSAQYVPIYDEAEVPPYTLPDPLVSEAGEAITTPKAWLTSRRPELLQLFADQVYGNTPQAPVLISYELLESGEALNGLATRKQVNMRVSRGNQSINIHLLIYLPAKVPKPVPAFLGLNFYGNHTLLEDSDVFLPDSWVRNNEDFGITENKATEASRGVRANRWPVKMILQRGYALGQYLLRRYRSRF